MGLNTWCKKTKIFYSKWVIHTFSVRGSMNAFRLQMISFSPPPPLLQMRKICYLLVVFQESICFTCIFYLLDFKDKWLCQKATLGLFFTKQMARGTFAFLCLKKRFQSKQLIILKIVEITNPCYISSSNFHLWDMGNQKN